VDEAGNFSYTYLYKMEKMPEEDKADTLLFQFKNRLFLFSTGFLTPQYLNKNNKTVNSTSVT
jgi:hypothetical protein